MTDFPLKVDECTNLFQKTSALIISFDVGLWFRKMAMDAILYGKAVEIQESPKGDYRLGCQGRFSLEEGVAVHFQATT